MTLEDAYKLMIYELCSCYPEVVLTPAPDKRHECHQIRVAVVRNPKWYRNLCAKYPSTRKDNPGGKRTKIKRQLILDLLDKLANGENPSSMYVHELKAVACSIADKYPF